MRAIAIKKADEELQVVWGEVYAPGIPDSQDDFMTAEAIRDMAGDLIRKGRSCSALPFQVLPERLTWSGG